MKWLLLAAIAGCAPSVEESFPTLSDGALPGTAVLLEMGEDRDNPQGAFGVVVDGRRASVFRELVARPNVAVLYRDGVEALSWSHGAFEHHEDARSRLRPPDEIYARDSDGAPWREVTAEALGWKSIPLLRLNLPDSCGTGGSCISSDDGLCLPRCPATSSVALPARPLPWPEVTCAPGMIPTSTVIAGDEISTCTAAGVATCAAFERSTVRGECVPLGSACAEDADEWPVPLPAGTLRYVSPAGPQPADGSRGAPWTLAQALRSAREGDTLVLTSSIHVAPDLVGPARLKIVGVCAELSRFVVRSSSTLAGQTWRLESLTLDTRAGRAVVGAGSSLDLDDVSFLGDVSVTDQGRMRAQESLILGPELQTSGVVDIAASELRGVNVLVFTGSVAIYGSVLISTHAEISAPGVMSVRGSVTTGAEQAAAIVRGGTLEWDHVVMVGGGSGINAGDDSDVTIRDTAFWRQEGEPIGIFGHDVRATIERVAILSPMKIGLAIQGSVTAVVTHLAIGARRPAHDQAVTLGIWEGASPDVTLSDVRIQHARDAFALEAGEVTMRRARFFDLQHGGFRATVNGRLELEAEDLHFDRTNGAGMAFRSTLMVPIEAKLARVHFDRSSGSVLELRQGPLNVQVTDLTITDVLPGHGDTALCSTLSHDFCLGTGVVVQNPGLTTVVLEMERVRIERVADTAIALGAGVDVLVQDGAVRGAKYGVFSDPSVDWRDSLLHFTLEAETLSAEAPF